MKIRIGFFIAFVVLAIHPPAANAWNPTGHEIVSMLAWDRLSPDAKAKVSAILEAHPRRDNDLLAGFQQSDDRYLTMFIVASTWPDMVRLPTNPNSHTDNHPAWHYVDFPYDMEPDGPQGPEPVTQWDGHSDPQNLLQAMQKLVPEFTNAKTSTKRQAIDLCWIEHLTGDAHQPLHAVSAYSAMYPHGDRGGNLEMITAFDGRTMNLHMYWDNLEGPETGLVSVRKVVDRLEAQHPASQYGDAAGNVDPNVWIKESFEYAKSVVYMNGKPIGAPRDNFAAGPPPMLQGDYEDRAHGLAEARIALAGYRLGTLVEKMVANMEIPTVNTIPVGSVVPAAPPTTQP